MSIEVPPAAAPVAGELKPALGFWQATALNISNMVGIGPFVTIPLIVAAMNGPQAMIAWILATLLVLCDGLVWAELAAALPGSGGSYHYHREVFGKYTCLGLPIGRVMPFLFIWQFLVTGTMELASGYLGAANFCATLFPALAAEDLSWVKSLVAAVASLLAAGLLCRDVKALGAAGVALAALPLAAIGVVIAAAFGRMDVHLLRPSDATVDRNGDFSVALGAAMAIAVYDFLGYYNICHLGEEVQSPAKTLPRSIIVSVLLVGALYLTMNTCILGVVPWQEAILSSNIAGLAMDKIGGGWAKTAITLLILGAAGAGAFAMTLGYSRIPYAAARNGDFFPIFARLDRGGRYPVVSLSILGAATAACCFFPLEDVIEIAVVVRIPIVFIGQILALALLHRRRDVVLPFRMWLYPLPCLAALFGWVWILSVSPRRHLELTGLVLAAGVVAFVLWRAVSHSAEDA